MRRRRSRHYRAQYAFRNMPIGACFAQRVDISAQRPPAETRETDDAIFLFQIYQSWRNASKTDDIWLHHRERHRSRNACIHRIAAAVEYPHGCKRGEIVTRRYRLLTSNQCWTKTRSADGKIGFAFLSHAIILSEKFESHALNRSTRGSMRTNIVSRSHCGVTQRKGPKPQ